MSMLPIAASTQIVPTGAISTSMSVVGLVAPYSWYMAGLSGTIIAYRTVPEIVTIVTLAVDDVVKEAVIGSKMIINCFAIAASVVAAIVAVRMGRWLIGQVNLMIPMDGYEEPPLDAYEKIYGGRLRGGGKTAKAIRERRSRRFLERRADIHRL